MPLVLNPNTAQTAVIDVPICFEGSGIISIPEEGLLPMDIGASGANWTYNSSTQTYKKVSGTNGTYNDNIVITTTSAHGLQPFYIRGCNTTFVTPGGSINNASWTIGVVDDQDNRYYLEVFKYCNADNSTCTGQTGSQWFMKVYVNGQNIHQRSVNFNEIFYVRSDGTNLYFEHVQGGVLFRDAMIELPESVNWRFLVSAGYIGNEITCLATYKGTYQGTLPIVWSAPLGGSLDTTTGSIACFTGPSAGTYSICLDYADPGLSDPICVDIVVDELTFAPVAGLPLCVFTGDIVRFVSNGGLHGTLTAVDINDDPIGTVIDPLTWQAPGSAVPLGVTLTYTLGLDSVNVVLFVINRLEVVNVEGNTLTGLIPGDEFQILTNYEQPYGIMEWENIDCPNVVSTTGLVSIPRRLHDDCFGFLDCRIKGTVINFGDAICPNFHPEGDTPVTVEIRILVDPVYPTPSFGGPKPLKWKPETPDYKVLVNEFEGGCDETYLRNRVGTHRWSIRYGGLPYESHLLCNELPCCPEDQGFIDGYDGRYHTVKRLDEFWNLVAGTAGYFTLFDYRTGEAWRKARFEANMERDHIHWGKSQSRDVSIIWRPCCAAGPLGGTCPHRTIIVDGIPPSIPQNLNAAPVMQNRWFITWDPSSDNIGVKGYELSFYNIYEGFDPLVITIGNETAYTFYALNSDPMDVKVRAFDFYGNYSEFSDLWDFPGL